MPKRTFKRTPKKATTASEEEEDASSSSYSNSRKLTMLLLVILPLPFLIGIFFGGTEFFMQEVKVKGLSTASSTSNFYSNHTFHHRLPIDPELMAAALEFVQDRREAYKINRLEKNWKLRGNGYLYTHKNIALAAQVVDASGNRNQISMGANRVQIFNVHPNSPKDRTDCDKLTLWVRVNGPEILSGKPYAVQPKKKDRSSCYWQFDFTISVPGAYQVDSKMVFWNGGAPVQFYDSGQKSTTQLYPETTQCKLVYSTNTLPQQQAQEAPQNTSLMGFKLYSPVMGCCEICRRIPECAYWATPPKIMPKPSMIQNGCEFYFAKSTNESMVPESRVMEGVVAQQAQQLAAQQAKAQAEADAAAQAQVDAQSTANANAQLAANQAAQEAANAAAQAAANLAAQQALQQPAQRSLVVSPEAEAAAKETLEAAMEEFNEIRSRQQLRRKLGDLNVAWGSPYSDNPEVAYFLGCGWSFHFTLEFPCHSGDLDDGVFLQQSKFEVPHEAAAEDNPLFNLPKNGKKGDLPLCTVWDESITPNVTAGVGRWVREPWPGLDECPPYEELPLHMKISKPYPNHPQCWNRGDLTHLNKACVEMNCNLIRRNSKYLSSPLQNEMDFNGVFRNYHCDYLQFTNDQLSQCFQKKGITQLRTNGASIAGMLKDYLNVRMTNITMAASGREIVLDSLRWPHLIWKKDKESWIKELEAIPAVVEGYWVSPMFTSSEREPYVQIDRGLQLLEVAVPIMREKNYHVINLFDPSAAMTYDTAGQADGLHIVGPPMKYAIDRIFHHICSGVVDGIRA